MKPAFAFVKSHSYEILVTALVLSLGVASRQLRRAENEVEAAIALSTPAPVTSPAPTLAPTATPEPARTWLRPVSGGILTAYSADQPLWSADMDCWQTHAAVDLSAAAGEPVLAAADGTISAVYDDPLLGLTVAIDHGNGYESLYAALETCHRTAGNRILAGESIGTAGNSADSEALLGCHLHFELHQNGLPVKPAFQ